MKTSIVEFKLFDELYCFNTEHVKYVYELEEYREVKGCSDAVVGIGKYNSDIILLVDTAKLYSDKSLDIKTAKSVIVVPDKEGLLYGLLVDEIIKLEEVEAVQTTINLNTQEMIVNHYRENDNIVNEIYPLPLLEKHNIKAIASLHLHQEEHIYEDKNEHKNYLLFKSGGKSFAIDSKYVKEVLENEFEIFELDVLEDSKIIGVIALRDEIVQLFDFNSKEKNDILILENKGQKIALGVDKVYDIEDFSTERIDYLSSKNSNNIEAFYNKNGSVVVILNPHYYFQEQNDRNKKHKKEEDLSLYSNREQEFLIFYIEKEKFALSMQYVRQVVESDSVTKTHSSAVGAKEDVAFLTTWNKRAVQVFNLKKYLKNSVKESQSEIVFIEVANNFVAFLVDEIENIIYLEKDAIGQMKEDDIISGAIVHNNEVIVQLNAKYLVKLD